MQIDCVHCIGDTPIIIPCIVYYLATRDVVDGFHENLCNQRLLLSYECALGLFVHTDLFVTD